MLHEGVLSTTSAPDLTDRRVHERVPCPGEVTLVWHHDLGQIVRYRLIDVSDGGFRIRSCTPLVLGMTGTVLTLLPRGETINQSVMVARVTPSEDGRSYEIGLRCFSPMG